jgi:hypothetical protein
MHLRVKPAPSSAQPKENVSTMTRRTFTPTLPPFAVCGDGLHVRPRLVRWTRRCSPSIIRRARPVMTRAETVASATSIGQLPYRHAAEDAASLGNEADARRTIDPE